MIRGAEKLRAVVESRLKDYQRNENTLNILREYISCLGMAVVVARLISATICDCLCSTLDDTE